jgi:hypothetical protein
LGPTLNTLTLACCLKNFKETNMKLSHSVAVVALALCAFTTAPAFAVDFEYFKAQSCPDLNKELIDLQKAEAAVKDTMKKADSKANTTAVVTTLLIGWPFWGNTDHGDSNAQLAELRTDIKYVTKAQKFKKCT